MADHEKKSKSSKSIVTLLNYIFWFICFVVVAFYLLNENFLNNEMNSLVMYGIAIPIIYLLVFTPIMVINHGYNRINLITILAAIICFIIIIIIIEDKNATNFIINCLTDEACPPRKLFSGTYSEITKNKSANFLKFIKKLTELLSIASLVSVLASYNPKNNPKKSESKNEQSNDFPSENNQPITEKSENNQPITEKSKSQNIKKESEFLNTSIGLVVIAFLISLITYKSEKSSEEKESPHG